MNFVRILNFGFFACFVRSDYFFGSASLSLIQKMSSKK